MPQDLTAPIDDTINGYLARIGCAGGTTARFYHDPYCEQPFDGDDAVRIVILHRRYIDPSRGACGSTRGRCRLGGLNATKSSIAISCLGTVDTSREHI